ncbi:MAG: serine/threonine protein kinase [Desulfobacterales bacterium]|nr:serine/threonine protein kinase [Desulfobacterales bacterium]
MVCLIIWIVAVVGSYFIYHSATSQVKSDFYQYGRSATQNLTAKIGSFLLEKDILSLNSAIAEITDNKNLIFAAILDHKDTIVVQTETDRSSEMSVPLRNRKFIGTIEGVSIESGVSASNENVIRYSKDVTYSGINIGKVQCVFSPSDLYRSLKKYKIFFISEVIFSFLLFSVILSAIDRITKARALRDQKEKEKMDRIGPYVLKEKIGQGGMAELFLADYIREEGFRKRVALKKILPHLVESPEFIKMFIREARLAAILQHPNIVQIFDFGKRENIYFIVMEYIYGKNLAEIINSHQGGLPVDQCVFIVSQICMGLQYSHAKKDDSSGEPLNIVHRDISPQNILISFQGEVKISDFGISKARSEPSMTKAGVIKGKLSYLSPEQALGQAADHQSDLYALGIVFYEMLSGKKLYHFDSEIKAIRSIPKMEIVSIIEVRPEIPEQLNNIVMKCLSKDKKNRYQSAQEILRDLVDLKLKLNMPYDRSNLSDFMKKHFSAQC